MLNSVYPYSLPPLPYAYDALEPYIDAEMMRYHHDKHFQAYVNNLNDALKDHPDLQQLTLAELLADEAALPDGVRTKIINNGGGVYNHDLFFNQMSAANGGARLPEGRLKTLIDQAFGSFDAFKSLFEQNALGVFGSGWTALALDKTDKLIIVNLKNQETLIPSGAKPLIIFDVWEHAYYLKYKNLRADFVKALWNIVGFPNIG